jgi:hypothetical protein
MQLVKSTESKQKIAAGLADKLTVCSSQSWVVAWLTMACRDLFPRGPPRTAQQAPLG